MDNKIYPCLWFNNNAKEAAQFYCLTFKNCSIIDDTPLVVTFESNGQKFMCLNGGSQHHFNPSISFYVVCETEEEINSTWENLQKDGQELMPLDKYDWSQRYGWVRDKFGVSWQLSLSKMEDVGQKFSPFLMFTGDQSGKAEDAVNFYTSIFKDSNIVGILRNNEADNESTGTVKHAQFSLGNNVFMVMDNSLENKFTFNEAISFVVDCDTQKEIDYFWKKLSEGGKEDMCGWLKDKFGVSWQIVPSILSELMTDPEKAEKVIKVFMQMKKFDIAKLVDV